MNMARVCYSISSLEVLQKLDQRLNAPTPMQITGVNPHRPQLIQASMEVLGLHGVWDRTPQLLDSPVALEDLVARREAVVVAEATNGEGMRVALRLHGVQVLQDQVWLRHARASDRMIDPKHA